MCTTGDTHECAQLLCVVLAKYLQTIQAFDPPPKKRKHYSHNEIHCSETCDLKDINSMIHFYKAQNQN